MTEHRQRLTTEDFAEREPVEQTPADRDVAEPDLTDQERFDREPAVAQHDESAGQRHDPIGRHDEPTGQQHVPVEQPYGESAGQQHGGFGAQDHDQPIGQQDESIAQQHGQFGAQDHEPVAQRHDEPVELSAVTTTPGDAPLFTPDDAADYQAEWRALQADFVDDPREAVQRADELVAQVMQSLATTFTQHKHSLEEQWQQGDEVQTEELRQALKRYRSFFDRLLSV